LWAPLATERSPPPDEVASQSLLYSLFEPACGYKVKTRPSPLRGRYGQAPGPGGRDKYHTENPKTGGFAYPIREDWLMRGLRRRLILKSMQLFESAQCPLGTRSSPGEGEASMKQRIALQLAHGAMIVVLSAGGASVAYADPGKNKSNVHDLTSIPTIIPRIGSHDVGVVSRRNVHAPGVVDVARPATSVAPLNAGPGALNAAPIDRQHGDSMGLNRDSRHSDLPGAKHGKQGRDWREGNDGKEGKDSASVRTRTSDKPISKDKSKDRDTAQGDSPHSEAAASQPSELEAARIARLPTCT